MANRKDKFEFLGAAWYLRPTCGKMGSGRRLATLLLRVEVVVVTVVVPKDSLSFTLETNILSRVYTTMFLMLMMSQASLR
jgi:hypothetical protein